MSLELRKEITLDIQSLQNTPQLTIKSGNNLSNVIIVTLQNNGEEVNLNGLNCRYCVLRADNTQNLSNAVIENNKVKITLTENDLQSPGRVSCELILSEDEKIVFSSTFYIMVLANVLDEKKVKNTDEYSCIINILDKADGLTSDISSLEQQVLNNEELRITSENLRIENENIRQQNEIQRQNSFTQIQTKSNEIIAQNQESTENAKIQGDYAKTQGDYAKEQADRIVDSDVSSLQNEINNLNLDVDNLQTETDNFKTEIDDLKGYVGYTNDDIFGVEVDFKSSTFTRLAGAKTLTEGADFDRINAYNRRRCILNDNGEVLAYYGDSGYIENGSIGQVMVEQPKFYYKVVPLELEPIANGEGYHLRKARYYICDTQKYGFKLHPAFIQNGVEKDKIYLSAYEGCIYDTSASTYLLNNEQVADFNSDKLCSIANAKPCSGATQQLTRANSRKLANNRGNGWNISTIQSISCTQLLFLIEYAYFNIQDKIGPGITKGVTDFENTGLTSNLGNKTGIGQNNSISYRGEENIYGNMWQYIDGINCKVQLDNATGQAYISDYNFADDVFLQQYKNTKITYPNNQAFTSAFGYNEEYDWLFIPSEIKGNDKIPIGDYFRALTEVTSTIGQIGGYYLDGTNAGLYFLRVNNPAYTTGVYNGARLIYVKQ